MQEIDYLEIQELTKADQPLFCIDVREGYRHATMDAGALKIPYNEIAQKAELLQPYKDWITVVCCLRPKGSNRTIKAANALRKLGFRDVRELKNGLYNGWIQKAGSRLKMPSLPKTLSP